MKRVIPALAAMLLFAAPANAQSYDFEPVSYTHLTLPTIYSV